MKVSDEIMSFFRQIQKDEFHRYKSWEHCYSYFSKRPLDIEFGSLHLAFYLASWGMYRGSSYLLWKDYKIHEKLVRELSSMAIEIDYENKEMDKSNAEKIYNIVVRIKEYYKNNIAIVNGKDKNVSASQTLATKILLGINGCTPAFDRYFVMGLKKKGFRKTTVSVETLIKIFQFYRNKIDEFKKAGSEIKKLTGIYYPPMKLVDMYFWEIGRKEDERQIKKKKARSI